MSNAPLTATRPAASPNKQLHRLIRSLVLERLMAPAPVPLRLNLDDSLLGTVRMNWASLSARIIHPVDARAIHDTISVPFKWLARLPTQIGARRRWRRIDDAVSSSGCDSDWAPRRPEEARQVTLIHTRELPQPDTPEQLYSFTSSAHEYQRNDILATAKRCAHNPLTLYKKQDTREAPMVGLQPSTQPHPISCRQRDATQSRSALAITAQSLNGALWLRAQQRAHCTTEPPILWRQFSHFAIRGPLFHHSDARLAKRNGRLPSTLSGLVAKKKAEQLHHLKVAA